jgi:hypothetical protein
MALLSFFILQLPSQVAEDAPFFGIEQQVIKGSSFSIQKGEKEFNEKNSKLLLFVSGSLGFF